MGAGLISANGQGGFDISGAHTYADEGHYTVGVTIVDAGGGTANASGTATVADADVLAGQGRTFTAIANQTLSNVVVAHFTDTYAASPAGDFTITSIGATAARAPAS